MFIVKKKKGWYWGTVGPFKTRKKALEIERAAIAYAAYYKPKGKKK